MKSKSKELDIHIFNELYADFIKIPTWTKLKKEKCDVLLQYLSKHSLVEIKSNRDSSTTRVHTKWEYKVYVVPENQKGYLIPFRGKEILMICVGRKMYTHILWCIPIRQS